MCMDRGRRQAVADHERQMPGLVIGRAGEALRGSLIEPASKIGTPEIIAAAAGPARHLEGAKTEAIQSGCQIGCMEGSMNGITGARVIECEIEQRRGRQARAGTTERDACRCEAAKI